MGQGSSVRILAFDPGGTTGWAQHVLFMEHITNPMVDINTAIPCGDLTGEHHGALNGLLRSFDPDIIVYERFDYQVRKTKAGNDRQTIVLDSVEYIGIIKLWRDEHTKCAIVPQGQMKDHGNGTTFWDDKKLAHIGVLSKDEDSVVNDAEHMNDAKRQLLSYITFNLKRIDYFKLLKRL